MSKGIIYNRFRSPAYAKQHPSSLVAMEMYNKITDELYKMMDSPNFGIRLVDIRHTRNPCSVDCNLLYADQIVGHITLTRNIINKTKREQWIITNICIRRKEWFNFPCDYDDWAAKYIGMELHDPRK